MRLVKHIHVLVLFIYIISGLVFADGTDPAPTPSAMAAKTGTIRGIISEYATNVPLAGANIFILNTTMGASSNADGYFEISEIPVGPVKLVVSYMGYKPQRRDILIEADQTVKADFSLRVGIMESSTIVVTGTSTPHLYEESPVKTEVIPIELIEQQNACNVAEALSLQTGLRIENNCQNCNFTQVRILGFDGKYTQMLIDGDPVVSSLAGVYALEQFPQEMIGQIEVVKGGGSALYGSGAMAGTINLRTRQPNMNRTRVNYNYHSLNGTPDQRASAVAELITDDGQTGAYIFGSVRNRSAYDHNGDGFTELGLLEHQSIGLNWYFRPQVTSELQASFQLINEDRRGGNDLEKPEHEADIAESAQHFRWGGKLRWAQRINSDWDYQAYYSFSVLDRDSYYGGLGGQTRQDSLDALKFYGNANGLTNVAGGQITYSPGQHAFSFGMQYTVDQLKDKSVSDLRYHIDHTYTNIGFFLQDDLSLLEEHLNIVAGARIDKHSEMEKAVLSPRVNAKYELLHDLYIRGAYTTGFRAPQTFDEDLHIEALGGEQRVVRNAPGLRPESSQSFSGGLEYEGFIGGRAVLIGVTGFYSKLKDAFVDVEIDNPDNDLILWQHVNSDGARVTGIEFDLGFKPNNQSELRAGYTYNKGNYDSQQEIFDGVFSDKFQRAPDHYGYFRASYDISPALNLFGSAKYTGIMYVPNEATSTIVKTTQDFLEFDLGATLYLNLSSRIKTEIQFGVKNLTNAYQNDLQSGVDRDPAYLYGPQMPRRIYAGVDFSF